MKKRIAIPTKIFSENQIAELILIESPIIQLIFIVDSVKEFEIFKTMYPDLEVYYFNAQDKMKIFSPKIINIISKILNNENTHLFLDRENIKLKGSKYLSGMHIFYQYIAKIVLEKYYVHEKLKIDFVIHKSTPHYLEWWIDSMINDHLNILNLRMGTGPIPWRLHLYNGIGRNSRALFFRNKQLSQIEEDKINLDIWINKIQGSYTDAIPDYEKQRLARNKGKHFNFIQELRIFYLKPQYIVNKLICYRQYSKLSRKIDFKNFVVFFLHYQPERTTTPEGYGFSSQYLAALAIRASLPDHIKLVIKEHPSIFTNKCSPKVRKPIFYNDLLEIPNVLLASLNETSFDLIDKSMAVVTISGTSGVEGLLRGKPVVYLGLSKFRDSYGVHQYENMDGLQSFFTKCILGFEKNKIIEETKKYLYESMENSIPYKNKEGKVFNYNEGNQNIRFEYLKLILSQNLDILPLFSDKTFYKS